MIIILCINNSNSQVEVRSTSPNSVLDINSPNKAVLLPRVNNTSLVNSPEEGLFVYNKASKTPSYHDGVQWNSVASMMMPTSDTDSLTYTILSGYGPPLPTGTFDLLAINFGTSKYNLADAGYFDMTKLNDPRSIGLMYLFLDQPSSNSISIEVKVYKNGESTPYFSYKFTNLSIDAISTGSSDGLSNSTVESYTLSAKILGFKDWVNNQNVAWNVDTQSIVSY